MSPIRKKKAAKRRETPATRRLKKENEALADKVEALSLSLKKEQTKNDCYHNPRHRYSVPRDVGDRMMHVTICGYCGRELSAEEMTDEARGAVLIDQRMARADLPGRRGKRRMTVGEALDELNVRADLAEGKR